MKPTDLINFRQLSIFLTGKPENIRKHTKPKHRNNVEELLRVVERWMRTKKNA